MSKSGIDMMSLLGNLDHMNRLLGNLERNGTKQHMKNAVKECLLASRSVIDSLVDTIEGESGTTAARKINVM